MNLGYYELIDRAERIDEEVSKYRSVAENHIRETAEFLFTEENSSILIYHSDKK